MYAEERTSDPECGGHGSPRTFFNIIAYEIRHCQPKAEEDAFPLVIVCLENGKTAKVNVLEKNEVGFGSTEYIVFRAINGISDEDFVYYLVCSPIVREPAIKSMVGSSGRQRVQTDVLKNLKICVPDLETQCKIGSLLKSIDDKISLNTKINENLAA